MNKHNFPLSSCFFILFLLLSAGCNTDKSDSMPMRRLMRPSRSDNGRGREVIVSPRAIPGTPRSSNNDVTGGYAPSNVQAQLKIAVQDGTREVKVIRDNTDPYVITKPYVLKHADPYAVRSYLEAAVGAKSVNASPAQVTAVRYADGTGVVLVSAEEYRFQDSGEGRGIDRIIASLDRKDLSFLPEADAHVYFPRISRACTLCDMLTKVGSSELDPEFSVAPGTLLVDGELNALIVKAPRWNWLEMLEMLKQYDQPIPEMRITYRVLEIYAENDDRIGVDFQSWKNNDGVDLFSAGTVTRRNWGTFFASGVQDTGSNHTSYWNFNPKWNTRYLDFMTSIGKAKCLAQGVLVAQNRKTSLIQVNSGFFYDRTYYSSSGDTLAERTSEFAYTDPNPDTIQRESITKIMTLQDLQDAYRDMGLATEANYITAAGYTRRMMGTQTTTNTYYDAIAKANYPKLLAQYGDATVAAAVADSMTSSISKYLTGYVKADGTVTAGTWYNTDWNSSEASPGIIHGWLQYPMVADGFQFNLKVTPVITGKAARIKFDLSGLSLIGWNSDGSPRRSESRTNALVQIGTGARDFVVGGIRKSESVRGTTGLPFFKDLPVIGRIFSTESESIKQSQLVLLARVELSTPTATVPAKIRENLGKVVRGVNKGMDSRVGNMFFQQYMLDGDRKDRKERLDSVGNIINDDYKAVK